MSKFTNKEIHGLMTIQQQIDEELNPSWETCLKELAQLKKAQFPRSFFWVNRVKDNFVLFHYSLDIELGYGKNSQLTSEFLIGTMHPNQRPILIKQIIAIYNLVLKYPDDFNNSIYLYGCKRAFKDSQGQFWLVYQTSKVLQTDGNGKIASNLNWFHILGKYKGQPLETEIFRNRQVLEKPKIPLDKIQNEFEKLKAHILKDLGFTKHQRRILELIATSIRLDHPIKMVNQSIAENMEISLRTVEGHRNKVVQLGRTIFPMNTFKDAVDVVLHLIAHDLV